MPLTFFSFVSYIKQQDFMLLCVCFEITDHRTHQNMVRESVTHLPIARWVPLFRSNHILKSPVIIFFFLLNRHTATWILTMTTLFTYMLSTGCPQNILRKTSNHINKKTSTTTKHSVDVTESAVYWCTQTKSHQQSCTREQRWSFDIYIKNFVFKKVLWLDAQKIN